MPVSFEEPATTAKGNLTATIKMEGTPESGFTKAENLTKSESAYIESLDKARQTKVTSNCSHGTSTLEDQLGLRGEPVEKAEAVANVSKSLIIQIVLTIGFCIAEFVTGVICSSIAMLADSYHMAADVMALIVAFTCIKIATRPSTRHGYGWVRAETLGGFFNGIFMCTVCVLVFQEAIGRVLNVHPISHPLQVLVVGFIGLLINIVGLCNLNGHGHSHGGGGGHGHSHGGGGNHGHSHSNKKNKKTQKEKGHGHSHANGHGHSHDHAEKECHDDDHSVSNCNNRGAEESAQAEVLTRLLEHDDDEIIERRLSGVNNHNAIVSTVDRQMTPYGTHMASEILNSTTIHPEENDKKRDKKKSKNVNIRGVWLHLLSDALGSVIVMVSAGCVYLWPQYGITAYLDPTLSILLASIMGITASVLVKTSGEKLLKRTPKGLNINEVKTDLCSIVGVSKVDKVSVWTLCEQRIIASVRVNVCHPAVFPDAAFKIKKYFHDMGVHSTTIEPTFEETCMQTMSVTTIKPPNGVKNRAPATVSTENEVTGSVTPSH